MKIFYITKLIYHDKMNNYSFEDVQKLVHELIPSTIPFLWMDENSNIIDQINNNNTLLRFGFMDHDIYIEHGYVKLD